MQEQFILDAFRTLQLSRDATLKEVRQSYRALVRSWHPDRYSHDLRLQEVAQERLKEINAAYNLARKNIRVPSPEVDSPFRFDLAAKTAGSIRPAEPAGEACGDGNAEKRQPFPVPSIERPITLNALFMLLFTTAAVLASRKHGASPEGFIHFLLVVMIPGLCAFLCNSSLRTLQMKRGYLAAIIIAGIFLLGEALSLRQYPQEATIAGPETRIPSPYADGPSSNGGGFGGEYTLGTDRPGQPGLLLPSAPLSPSAPSVPAPAPPDPPRVPLRR